MTNKFYSLYLKANDLSRKHLLAADAACQAYEKECEIEPSMDSQFMQGIHYENPISREELEKEIEK